MRNGAELPSKLPRADVVEAARQGGAVSVVHLHLAVRHGDAVGEAEPCVRVREIRAAPDFDGGEVVGEQVTPIVGDEAETKRAVAEVLRRRWRASRCWSLRTGIS